ncbi:uncharacterized protein YndB with AHSA1/START domain [Sediminihabitans luteus]|uniref:Uncharacterized protein YndB with AHSA1/START domain n=1 Tax=Sediminihabitans luteus TaxID=1138585 RepID=A0A2M9D0Y8_9CELL|nr:SRPBCC family protein [Sediminihabitans luteus]PJJ77839.1 uncharacterized protein YndB with AHSA1/START domain [Sediminihabitans luteus]GII99803.1 ATPase [Sediminihabitans luteus]
MTTHPTTVTAEPGTPFIDVTRDFDAPRELLFRAMTDAELVPRWLGPHRYAMRLDHYDARTGGSWAYAHVADDGEFGFHGSFHSVTPPESAVQTFEFAGYPGHVSLEAMTLTALPDGGTRLHVHATYQSVEDRDGMLASGMEGGMTESYDRLDALTAELTA